MRELIVQFNLSRVNVECLSASLFHVYVTLVRNKCAGEARRVVKRMFGRYNALWLRYWPTLLSLLLYSYFPMVTPRGLSELHWIAPPRFAKETPRGESCCAKHDFTTIAPHWKNRDRNCFTISHTTFDIGDGTPRTALKSLLPFSRTSSIFPSIYHPQKNILLSSGKFPQAFWGNYLIWSVKK